MKLYTEEQLLNTIEAIRDYVKNYPEKFHESMIEKHLKNLEPIELPSDEEMVKEKYEHEICVFADEYASYILDQSKLGIKGAMVSMCAWTFFNNRRNDKQ
jgi:hypothetical protein